MTPMAKRTRRLFLFPFLLSLFVSPAFGRKLPPQSAASTATLDVVASLDQALRALSFDPTQTHDSLTQEAAAAGSISLRLHSRDYLPAGTRHPDYKALTLARLRRDSARVAALAARLSFAAGGTLLPDLKPAAMSAEAVQGPVVSGTSQGSGEYFSRVGIGSPAKELYMVLDTGSDVTWVQCQPCADCYQQSDPIFDPSASTSYSILSCNSSKCRALDVSACRKNSSAASYGGSGAGQDGSCLYQVSYGDGSYTVGDFATETLTFGSSTPVAGVAIGCGHDNEGLFVGAAGILSLGGGTLSFPSQISARSFSYCLVDRDSPTGSTLEIGKSSAAGGVTATLLRNQKLETFYYVGLAGISVGGEMLSIPAAAFAMAEDGTGGVIVDSGTAVTRLSSVAYASLRAAFREKAKRLPDTAGVSLFDTCYNMSGRRSVEVPTVALHFSGAGYGGGGDLRLPAKNYLIPVDSMGTYCLAFAATAAPLSIIGNVQQQGTRVTFDLANNMVGFTPNQC